VLYVSDKVEIRKKLIPPGRVGSPFIIMSIRGYTLRQHNVVYFVYICTHTCICVCVCMFCVFCVYAHKCIYTATMYVLCIAYTHDVAYTFSISF